MILADEEECDPEVPIVNGGLYFGSMDSKIDANAVETASLTGIAQCSIKLTQAQGGSSPTYATPSNASVERVMDGLA